MAYRIELTNPAKADAYLAFERVREVAPTSAERWLRGLFAAILTLSDMPARCPVIPEADELRVPLRHLIRQAQRVFPHHLRHPRPGRRRPLRPRSADMARCA